MANIKVCDICGKANEIIFEGQFIPKLKNGELSGWEKTDLCIDCEKKYEDIYYPHMVEIAKKWNKVSRTLASS